MITIHRKEQSKEWDNVIKDGICHMTVLDKNLELFLWNQNKFRSIIKV